MSDILGDPARVDELRRSELMDCGPEEVFDQLADALARTSAVIDGHISRASTAV